MNLLFTGASGFLGNNIYPLLKDNYFLLLLSDWLYKIIIPPI